MFISSPWERHGAHRLHELYAVGVHDRYVLRPLESCLPGDAGEAVGRAVVLLRGAIDGDVVVVHHPSHPEVVVLVPLARRPSLSCRRSPSPCSSG